MNIVADIGNSQIKIAIERKNGISKVKAFQSNDFKDIKKIQKIGNIIINWAIIIAVGVYRSCIQPKGPWRLIIK